MPDLATLISQGSSNLLIFIPTALLLGALHGLEPGHSKTMMAAFIVAVRGTVSQAIMLGLAATISHTLVVWLVAMLGLYLGSSYDIERIEPILQAVSGLIIILIALWLFYSIRKANHHHDHDHDHDRDHDHDHDYDHDHEHDGEKDAHTLMHEKQIAEQFKGGTATTAQIIVFGLTGGLIPCPASITVLLICLQLKKVALGALLVLCFSIGLAATMVAAGVIAALSVKGLQSKWSGFDKFAQKAPYLSVLFMLLLGIYLLNSGLK